MEYVGFLQGMLKPFGVYNLNEDSFSGGSVYAKGAALEEMWQYAQEALQEMIIATAEDQGLTQWEQVFPYRGPVETAEERRAALGGFLSISGDGFTLSALSWCLSACGVTCQLLETDTPGRVEISFPGIMGEPDQYDTVLSICDMILPCHLQVDFCLRFCTWAESATLSWGDLESYTWGQWERLAVADL